MRDVTRLLLAGLVLMTGCEQKPEQDFLALPEQTVEFIALREGICRSIWVRGDQIISSEIIECPKEELEGYIK